MQPAFLLAIFDAKGDTAVQLANIGGVKQTTNEHLSGSLGSETCSLVNAILQFVESSNDVINRYFVAEALWFHFSLTISITLNHTNISSAAIPVYC